MWAHLRGSWHSSTRAELAALLLAIHIQEPLHIGIDNKAVVDKATKMILGGSHVPTTTHMPQLWVTP